MCGLVLWCVPASWNAAGQVAWRKAQLNPKAGETAFNIKCALWQASNEDVSWVKLNKLSTSG